MSRLELDWRGSSTDTPRRQPQQRQHAQWQRHSVHLYIYSVYRVYTCIYIHIHKYIYVYMYMCMRMCIYATQEHAQWQRHSMHICIYSYIVYIYTYSYIYIYIYIYEYVYLYANMCSTTVCPLVTSLTAPIYIVDMRGGGLGSRPKKMYGERLGDGVEYHLMSPTPRR